MKLVVDDITEIPTTLEFSEGSEDLDARLQAAPDWRAAGPLACDLTHYRAGDDLVLTGGIVGQLQATCARCAEEFLWPLSTPFDLILSPRPRVAPADGALSADDVAVGFYQGPEVDLSPLVCEQALLALPTRPLCRDDCRGLCPDCGVNMNTTSCTCEAKPTAPRLTQLGALLREK